MIFDSHAHYDDRQFKDDRHEAIMKAKNEGVALIMNVGASVSSSKRSVNIAKKYDFIYSSVGVHPHYAEKLMDTDMEVLRDLAGLKKVKAIGEIGLDYYRNLSPVKIQKKWFIEQINMARDVGLPVIIHSRDAAEDTMKILKSENAGNIGGVVHCFSGSVETMRETVAMGLYIGIVGTVTFKNANKIIEVVKNVPEDRLLIETDCPYMAPEPYRGKRNYSGYLDKVVERIADIRGVSIEHIEDVTYRNACRLFKI